MTFIDKTSLPVKISEKKNLMQMSVLVSASCQNRAESHLSYNSSKWRLCRDLHGLMKGTSFET